jgi:hypothetical protein
VILRSTEINIDLRRWGSYVIVVSDYRLENRVIGVRSPAGAKVFPVNSVSRPALRPTHPPIQLVRESFPGGKARPGPEADHSPCLVPR